ncbi:hypothetical protein [Flagellimonas okinawensis]|uniref:hypothetical protein n=1 Tax=Flagellimonas okinawensis TaxID=3031324 RepID=UPI003AB0E009
MINRFHHLKYSQVAILGFVVVKLILAHHYSFPEWASLGFIVLSLAIVILASSRKEKE